MLKLVLGAIFCIGTSFAQPEVSIFDMVKDEQTQKPQIQDQIKQKNERIQPKNERIRQKIEPKKPPISIPEKLTIEEIKKIAPTDEPENVSDEQIYQQIEPKELNIKVTANQKSVLPHQIFSETITINTNQELSFDLNLSVTAQNLNWLNPKPEWLESKKGIYNATLWFEASGEIAQNDAKIALYRNDELFQTQNINLNFPRVKSFNNIPPNFANIVADTLNVKKFKVSKFDEKNNLINMEVTAKNTSLASFFIPQENAKQGIESIKGSYANQSGNYFMVVGNDVKSIEFSYYSLKSCKFETFHFDIAVEKEDLSTQVDLNPKDSEFEFYKDIFVYVLIIICLILFIWRKNYYSLFFAAILGGYAIYDSKPFSDGMLKANSEVKILPTKNSTIFYVTQKDEKIKIILKQSEFSKVILENDKIGWVKNENIK